MLAKKDMLNDLCAGLCDALSISHNRRSLAEFQISKASLSSNDFLEYLRDHVIPRANSKLLDSSIQFFCWDRFVEKDFESFRSHLCVLGPSKECSVVLWKLFCVLSTTGMVIDSMQTAWLLHRLVSNVDDISRLHSRNLLPINTIQGQCDFWSLLDKVIQPFTDSSEESHLTALNNILSEVSEKRILKQGVMMKKGHLVKNWKERRFILYPGQLVYYTLDSKPILQGSCSITSRSVVQRVSGYSQYDHRFLVTCGETGKEFEISAPSSKARDEWIAHIQFSICHPGLTTLDHFLQKYECVNHVRMEQSCRSRLENSLLINSLRFHAHFGIFQDCFKRGHH